MDAQAVREAARAAVSEICRTRVADSEPLVSSGRIDSLSILDLIAKLEGRLGITIPTDRVQPDDFDSVDMIVETLARVTGGHAP